LKIDITRIHAKSHGGESTSPCIWSDSRGSKTILTLTSERRFCSRILDSRLQILVKKNSLDLFWCYGYALGLDIKGAKSLGLHLRGVRNHSCVKISIIGAILSAGVFAVKYSRKMFGLLLCLQEVRNVLANMMLFASASNYHLTSVYRTSSPLTKYHDLHSARCSKSNTIKAAHRTTKTFNTSSATTVHPTQQTASSYLQ
jgi:hypothetical protein